MEKKITKKIRKKVAECMSESIDAVEVMRVSEAIGITADAIYAVPTAAAAERELMAYVTIFFLAFWAMVLPEFIAAIGKTIFG